jgi:hypothetical protein
MPTIPNNHISQCTIWLNAGQTKTISTGGWRPSGLKGTLYVGDSGGSPYRIASTSILGHETETGGFSAGCWNSSGRICWKRSDWNDPIKEDDYGFCKE